jgi:uncharacterized protein HemX
MSNQELEHVQETPDSWHRHGNEEGAPQNEHGAHASARALAITFIAMTLGVAFVIIILMAYFNSYNARFKEQVQETTTLGEPVRVQHAADLAELQSYKWVDQDTIKIPIDQAMKAVVEQGNGAG